MAKIAAALPALAGASMPMLATTVGLQLGSMLMNSMAKKRQQRARDAYLEAQDQRLGGLMDEAMGHTQANTEQYAEPARAAQEGEIRGDLERTAAENDLGTSTISDAAVGPQGSNAVMIGARERARAPEEAHAAQQLAAQHGLRTSGDSLFRLGLDTARTGQNVSKLGGFMRGSATPLQLELKAADAEGQGLQNLGDLFQTGASIAGGKIFGGGGGAPTTWGMTKSAPYAGPGGIMMRSF